MNLGQPTRIAILSDIHGNASALEAAITCLQTQSIDHCVILGDLLTYGCEVATVLDGVEQLMAEYPTTLIKGNHDQLYLDLYSGNSEYLETLPDWIRESVLWTSQELGDRWPEFARCYPWQEAAILGDCYVAHANPFPYGNWTYLNLPTDYLPAFDTLKAHQFQLGIFGHTHRPQVLIWQEAEVIDRPPTSGVLGDRSPPGVAILNPGSVGQPRQADRCSRFLILEQHPPQLLYKFIEIDYDLTPHLSYLEATSLSPSTKAKIRSFLI